MKHLLNELDRSATDAAARYKTFTGAIIEESHRAMIGPNGLSAARGKTLKASVIKIAQTYLSFEEARIELEMDTLTQSALGAALDHLRMSNAQVTQDALRGELSASREASASYLLGELTSQVNRDVNQTIKSYRNACLRVVMKQDGAMMSTAKAKDQVLFEEIQAERQMTFTDRAGRKTRSDAHVRRIWRESARDNWAQSYLQTLAHMGEAYAAVWHPDVSSNSFGRRIVIAAPDYGLEDRSKVFHPNARAIPVALDYMELVT